MTPGKKSTEFYLAVFLVGVWAIKYLGLEAYITPENVNQVAEAIKAGKAQGIDMSSAAGLAYVVGRPLVKIFTANRKLANE